MGMAHRFSGPGKPYEGLTTIRRGKVDWTGKARFIPSSLDEPLTWRKPQRVFVNSMSDLFHESLSNEEIAAVFGVMAACPQHTFQVLTKRPERMRKWFEWVRGVDAEFPALACGIEAANRGADVDYQGLAQVWPLPNVWLGTSTEDQATAEKRIPDLLATPAAVRFISAEPLLDGLDLTRLHTYSHGATSRFVNSLRGEGIEYSADGGAGIWTTSRLDWVIVGGESGPGARPFDVAWAHSIVAQCKAAGVACFVKQFGTHVRDTTECGVGICPPGIHFKDRKGGDWSEWPEDLRVREFPTDMLLYATRTRQMSI
jgi:protein gp37